MADLSWDQDRKHVFATGNTLLAGKCVRCGKLRRDPCDGVVTSFAKTFAPGSKCTLGGTLISTVYSPPSVGLIAPFCLPIIGGSSWKPATALVPAKGGHRRAIDVTEVGTNARCMYRSFRHRCAVRVHEEEAPLPEYVEHLRAEITAMCELCDLREDAYPVSDDSIYSFIRSKIEALSVPEVRERYGESVDGYSPLDHLGLLVYSYVESRMGETLPLAVGPDFVQRDLDWVTDVLDKFSQPID